MLISLWVRTRELHAGFWIDEGISVGIAHEHWTSIPHLLRQDGSPPLYYMLLGLWVRAFGDTERATHALSLVFGLLCIPLAYFAAARSSAAAPGSCARSSPHSTRSSRTTRRKPGCTS